MVLDLDTMEKKGTVTPISSVFSVEDAQKASKQVQDTIVERQQQLDQLRTFTKDNTNLINLVQKLPEEIDHNIMVPFGKAAFFPGRLIHTNEFMVLLGEGYYTERTSKQTVDILKRRGKTLETQVESLKAVMQDLKVEASFFDATAHESAEGLVEIREDYVDEDISGLSPTPDNRVSESPVSHEVEDRKAAFEDEEYMRILSRISELEKEEEEAEKSNEDEKVQDELVESMHQVDIDESARHSPASFDVKMSEVRQVPMVSKDGPSHGNIRAPKPSMVNKTLEPPLEKAKAEAPLTTINTAFTGSIVERAQHIDTAISEQPASARPSKPVSRFKMQRK